MSFIPLGILAASGAGGGGAYESIATATGTGSSGTITFSSIPSTYTSLQIRIMSKSTRTASTGTNDAFLRLNNDTGSNYAYHDLYGDGTSAGASGAATQTAIRIQRIAVSSGTGLSNMMGVAIVDLHDYASTTKNKTVRNISGADLNGVTSGSMWLSSGLWQSTTAVNRLDLYFSGENFTTTTVVSLYGIKGA